MCVSWNETCRPDRQLIQHNAGCGQPLSALAKWCWFCPSTAASGPLRASMGINPNGNAHWLDSDSSWPITPDEAMAEGRPLRSNTHSDDRPPLLRHIYTSDLTNWISFIPNMKQKCTLTALSAEAEGAASEGQIFWLIVLCHFPNCAQSQKLCCNFWGD